MRGCLTQRFAGPCRRMDSGRELQGN
jgi:hypothetical protein